MRAKAGWRRGSGGSGKGHRGREMGGRDLCVGETVLRGEGTMKGGKDEERRRGRRRAAKRTRYGYEHKTFLISWYPKSIRRGSHL